MNTLSTVEHSVFENSVTASWLVPTSELKCQSVTCKHNYIYVAGRYCKFSRELSQSPWIVDGVKAMDTSVQEIIFEKFTETFG